jgi:hypothetical protein
LGDELAGGGYSLLFLGEALPLLCAASLDDRDTGCGQGEDEQH